MDRLARFASRMWGRIIASRRGGGDGSESDGGEGAESTPSAFSSLDASVNYAHGEPQNGVRELQRVNEQANELADAHPDDR